MICVHLLMWCVCVCEKGGGEGEGGEGGGDGRGLGHARNGTHQPPAYPRLLLEI